MTSSNTLIVTSRLGRDPEMQYLSNGTALTKFSLPVDIGYGDKASTEWINVAIFGKRAEQCNEHLRKGSLVAVTGKLEKTWVSDQGKASIQMKAIEVDFIADFGRQEEKQDTEDMPF